MYDAWKDKIEHPDDWVSRSDLRSFLNMDGSRNTFNNWINEIECLEDSYLYIQGTLETNETFNKVRIYNYITQKRLEEKRKVRMKKGA